MTLRTRFAPSPTGFLSIGNARAALFNYLFAKKEGGVCILRIEDTDKERSKKEYENDMIENFHWLGLEWDEGPEKGGPYAPYRQSERTELYKKYLLQLLQEGKAYYCFCSSEELEAQRQYQLGSGETPKYLGTCRNLSQEEVEKNQKEKKPSVIRFVVKMQVVSFKDTIRGEITFDSALLGDFVIAKDLESPLYNFSVVVDDHEMNITHVIRGEDHISNTPKQILMQEALGFSKVCYGHLPLVLGPDRTKLSKRHGDSSVRKFREEGYLPKAIINFLALLGWNSGDEKEIFSMEDLIKEFSLARIQKGGAIFNIQRLDWINGHYIRYTPAEELTKLCVPYLAKSEFITPLWQDEERTPTLIGQLGKEILQKDYLLNETKEKITFETLVRIISLYQERLKKLSEISEFTDFFFRKKLDYPKEFLRWKDATDAEIQTALKKIEHAVATFEMGEWSKRSIESLIMPEAEKEKNRGYMLWPFRVALCGKSASAGPFEIAEILGKEKTLQRVKEALEKF